MKVTLTPETGIVTLEMSVQEHAGFTLAVAHSLAGLSEYSPDARDLIHKFIVAYTTAIKEAM